MLNLQYARQGPKQGSFSTICSALCVPQHVLSVQNTLTSTNKMCFQI